MKLFLFCALLSACFCYGCNNEGANTGGDLKKYTATVKKDSANAPILLFEKGSYDFGTITQGEKVTYNFKFKNAGKSPLIITDASSSCGCTVPEPPKEPIKPGQSAALKVVFDSAGKLGKIEKVITVNSNAVTQFTDVYLTGEIKSPPAKK